MFLHMSVILSTGGEAWFYSGGVRGFYSRGACVVLFGGRVWFYPGGMRGFIWGGHAWFYLGGMHGFIGGHAWFYLGGCAWFFQFFWIQWDTVNEWAVRILLECILVSQASVILLTGGVVCGFIWGGHAWFLFGGHAWFYLGGMRSFIQGGHVGFYSGGACIVFIQGVCVVLSRGACMVLFGGCVHGFFQFFRIQWDTVNERVVCILLECILVYWINSSQLNWNNDTLDRWLWTRVIPEKTDSIDPNFSEECCKFSARLSQCDSKRPLSDPSYI